MRCSAADDAGRGNGSTSGGTSLATVPTGVVRACLATSPISKSVSHTRCFNTKPTSAKLQPATLEPLAVRCRGSSLTGWGTLPRPPCGEATLGPRLLAVSEPLPEVAHLGEVSRVAAGDALGLPGSERLRGGRTGLGVCPLGLVARPVEDLRAASAAAVSRPGTADAAAGTWRGRRQSSPRRSRSRLASSRPGPQLLSLCSARHPPVSRLQLLEARDEPAGPASRPPARAPRPTAPLIGGLRVSADGRSCPCLSSASPCPSACPWGWLLRPRGPRRWASGPPGSPRPSPGRPFSGRHGRPAELPELSPPGAAGRADRAGRGAGRGR